MIYSFLYVIVFSFALILIQKLDSSVPPLFSLLITSSIATIYFNLINRKHIKFMYTDCMKNKMEWLSVMFIVLIMWATTMIGPGKIGASLFNFIYFAWLGTIGMMMLGSKNWEKNKSSFWLGLLVFLLILFSILLKAKSSFSISFLYGIGMAILGGTSSFIYFRQSQNLSTRAHLTATQVLAVRFYLAIFVLALLVPKEHITTYMTAPHLIELFILAFFSLITPLYFSQKALEKITPEQHAIINSLCPFFTGILQKIIFNDITIHQISIYAGYSLLITSFYFFKKWSD